MKYPTISSAIEFAQEDDILVADPATYNGLVRFNGKNLHLKSTNPDDAGVVGSTVINAGSSSVDVARFSLGEDSSSMLEGLLLPEAIMEFPSPGTVRRLSANVLSGAMRHMEFTAQTLHLLR